MKENTRRDRFFEQGYKDHTIVKLEVFREYLTAWLPTFLIGRHREIFVGDLMAGPGQDKDGRPGSPQIIFDTIERYKEQLALSGKRVRIVLNDSNPDYARSLHNNFAQEDSLLTCTAYADEFSVAIERVVHEIHERRIPALLFVDQFGWEQMTRDFFLEIMAVERTELLFFISTHYMKMFLAQKNIPARLGLDFRKVGDYKGWESHREVRDAYDQVAKQCSRQIYVCDFALQTRSNTYGLIFATGHLLGVEKFLRVAWGKDPKGGCWSMRGEEGQMDLDLPLGAVNAFQSALTEILTDRGQISNREIVEMALVHGLLPTQHAKPIVDDLIKSGRAIQIRPKRPRPQMVYTLSSLAKHETHCALQLAGDD